MEDILRKHPTANVRVFAVWEPILSFDSEPGVLILNRMKDVRVRQYWDADRLIAEQLALHGDPAQKEPECCFHRKGVLWDLAAVYPSRAVWRDRMPLATIFGGPVVGQARAIEQGIERLAATTPKAP